MALIFFFSSRISQAPLFLPWIWELLTKNFSILTQLEERNNFAEVSWKKKKEGLHNFVSFIFFFFLLE